MDESFFGLVPEDENLNELMDKGYLKNRRYHMPEINFCWRQAGLLMKRRNLFTRR